MPSYLIDVYAYKPTRMLSPHVTQATESPEAVIRSHLYAGNTAFLRGQYAAALAEYQRAWQILPSLVHPVLGSAVGMIDEARLLAIDLVGPLLEASVQIQRMRAGVGPAATIVPAMHPPQELLELADRYTGRADRVGQLQRLAAAHHQSGNLEFAQQYADRALEAAGNDGAAASDAWALRAGIALARGDADGARQV